MIIQNSVNHVKSREQIRARRLNKTQTEGNAFPVKQHPECLFAMKIAKEREQEQRMAGNTSSRNKSKHSHLGCRLNGMAGGRVHGWISRGKGKNNSTMASSKVEVPLTIHQRWTPEREVKTPAPHKTTLLVLHLQFFSVSQQCFFQVKTSAFVSSPQAVPVSALCLAHRHSSILLVQCCGLAY